jgi:hypothetical protein
MLVRPSIGGWEPKGIQRLESEEMRRLVRLPIPGLAGELHQDLGRGALAVRLSGTLAGDEARDAFLAQVRERFLKGEPVDFVADIVAESQLDQVLVQEMRLEEVAGDPDGFRYEIVLVEYTEPPEPPAPDLGLGLDLGFDINLGLDLLDLAGILGEVPTIGPLLEPIKAAAEDLASALEGAADLLSPIADLLD